MISLDGQKAMLGVLFGAFRFNSISLFGALACDLRNRASGGQNSLANLLNESIPHRSRVQYRTPVAVPRNLGRLRTRTSAYFRLCRRSWPRMIRIATSARLSVHHAHFAETSAK